MIRVLIYWILGMGLSAGVGLAMFGPALQLKAVIGASAIVSFAILIAISAANKS